MPVGKNKDRLIGTKLCHTYWLLAIGYWLI